MKGSSDDLVLHITECLISFGLLGTVEASSMDDGSIRITVVCEDFEAIPPIDRQDILWRMVELAPPREGKIKVIETLSPSELGMDPSA